MKNKKRIGKSLDVFARQKQGMTNNHGRSMVEMLGVLAIIGVLSAGALKGYSDAMFKYKMNQTIDITTKMFQRFEEINQKDWGSSTSEGGSVTIYADETVSWGLLEECDIEYGDRCRLPVGGVYIELTETPEDGHYGIFDFFFNSAKECIAFASVHWEQMLPSEWWYPNGSVSVGYDYYLYYPAEGINTIPTASQIANACQNNYIVRLEYRDY